MVLSMPKERSRVRRALPDMALICELRKALRALFTESELGLPSERYMPVVSIVTAIFPRFSADMVISSL